MVFLIWLNLRRLATPLGQEYALNFPHVHNPGALFPVVPSCCAFRSSLKRVYYSLAVWRFKPILSAGLRFHTYLCGGLRLRNYRAVAGNHKFSSRFSVFACFCGRYSNRVERLRRLSGNFILLQASLFNKGLPFRARPSQSVGYSH